MSEKPQSANRHTGRFGAPGPRTFARLDPDRPPGDIRCGADNASSTTQSGSSATGSCAVAAALDCCGCWSCSAATRTDLVCVDPELNRLDRDQCDCDGSRGVEALPPTFYHATIPARMNSCIGAIVGSLQLMLDRGQIKDWFHSTEIWIEATIAGLCFYLLAVHTMTTGERSFLNRELLKSPNFVAGSLLMFGVGMILSGTLALMPSMMQVLMNYPVFDAGWMMAPRGFGTMLAMFLVARVINRIDNRLFILVGFLLTAASLWQMTGYSLYMGPGPILFAGFAQGFGLGCTFVPLNLLALSGLPHHILSQGTALRALMRMLGGSIGIAILETQLSQNTQIVHSRLIEHLRPDNPLAQAPYLTAPFSLTDPSGIAALNHEVTRQAAMVAYNDDFALMLWVILACLPLLLLIRGPRREPMPAAADD